jgi:hypothetical protein
MLIVLEIAPDMKGCVAAIMAICAFQSMLRVPFLPEGVAVSNTGRSWSLRPGAPSRPMVPQA